MNEKVKKKHFHFALWIFNGVARHPFYRSAIVYYLFLGEKIGTNDILARRTYYPLKHKTNSIYAIVISSVFPSLRLCRSMMINGDQCINKDFIIWWFSFILLSQFYGTEMRCDNIVPRQQVCACIRSCRTSLVPMETVAPTHSHTLALQRSLKMEP